MEIPKQLNDEIWEFCRVNNLTNIDEFTLKLLTQGFTVEKFGATPQTKIVEKIVEKIIEVPINLVDDELAKKYKELLEENEKLKSELSKLKNKNTNNNDIYGEN